MQLNKKLIAAAVVVVLIALAAFFYTQRSIEKANDPTAQATLPGSATINEGQGQSGVTGSEPSAVASPTDVTIVPTPTVEPTGDRYTFIPDDVPQYEGDKSQLPGEVKSPLGLAQLEGQGMVGNDHSQYTGEPKKLYDTLLRVISVTDNRYGPAYDSPKQAYDKLLSEGVITQSFYDAAIDVYSPYGGAVKAAGLTLQQQSIICAIQLDGTTVIDTESDEPKTVMCRNERKYVTPEGDIISSSQFENMTGTETIPQDRVYNSVTIGFVVEDGKYKVDSLLNSDNN